MPEWLTRIPADFWNVLAEMSPYLLFGFAVAGLLSVLISPELIRRHLGAGRFWPVVKAAAFGVPLPLCSCGVIPVSASLRKHGASKGATVGFLISTPQTGVDSILVTYSLLGPVFAIYRPLAALVSGVLGGVVTSGFEKGDRIPPPEAECADECCAGSSRPAVIRAMRYGFVTLPQDIGRSLLVGLLIAALISAVVPKGYFSTLVPPGALQVLVLMAAGIPIYVCATASIPIAAGLILAGVSPGAAFAFLMTGPATNAATIATLWKLLGRRTTVIYLATMVVTAFVGGMALDQFLTGEAVASAMHHDWMPQAVKTVSAVALLGVLLWGSIVRTARGKPPVAPGGGEVIRLGISGMTCSHCAESVRDGLSQCPGVTSVRVDLATNSAVVAGEHPDIEALRKIVQALGYNVTSAEPELRGEP